MFRSATESVQLEDVEKHTGGSWVNLCKCCELVCITCSLNISPPRTGFYRNKRKDLGWIYKSFICELLWSVSSRRRTDAASLLAWRALLGLVDLQFNLQGLMSLGLIEFTASPWPGVTWTLFNDVMVCEAKCITRFWKIKTDLTRAGSARLFSVLDSGELLGERSWHWCGMTWMRALVSQELWEALALHEHWGEVVFFSWVA